MFRGGPGVDYQVRMHEPVIMHFRSEGIGPPSGYGTSGGSDGLGGFMEVTEDCGNHDVPPDYGSVPYNACVYHALSPGGGGWGDPHERDPAMVAQDVLDGVVSHQAARDVYGVVLNEDASQVDEEATRVQRSLTNS